MKTDSSLPISFIMIATLRKFSLDRHITSYAKLQYTVAALIRGNQFFVAKKSVKNSKLLNVGCGPNPHPDYINLDFHWNRDIDICWDITKKSYPIHSSSLEGIYTEHCLEHISFDSFNANMAEFYRMLKPGSVVRIIMPDGELYLDIYQKRKNGENIRMPHEVGYITPMARINGIFRNHGHQFIYDFETMKKLLQQAGFTNIKKCSYRTGADQRLLVDQDWRAVESLYVEATR